MNYQKGSVSAWATCVVIAIIVAGGAYWYWSQGSTMHAASSGAQPVSVQNNNGGMTATPVSSGTWQFSFTGPFGYQQDSYSLDLGDGTKVDLSCQTFDSNDDTSCTQLAPVTHAFAKPGTYSVNVIDTFVGAGSESTSTIMSLTIEY